MADIVYIYANNQTGQETLGAIRQISGGLAVAADKGYRNGVAESGTIGAKAGSFTELRIAAENYGGLPTFFDAITIQTIVIWETSTGHATWMPAVMAAAAAL